MASREPDGSADRLFAIALLGAGLFVLLLMVGILLTLFAGGWPAFRHFGGFRFLLSTDWNPVAQSFGALIPMVGTVATAILAMTMAVPIAFGLAVTMTELVPRPVSSVLGLVVELLAAVPSIIYGMWGFTVLVPLVAHQVQPSLQHLVRDVPGLGALIAGPAYGTGLFTAAIVLAVMTVPFIAATMRDVFRTAPLLLRESAFGLGCTRWEVVRRVVLPHTRGAVVGGIMLGLGRALGETMAVTFVIGNTNRLPHSLFAPASTIASMLALNFPESPMGSLQLSSLLAMGFILFAISFVVLAASRLLLRPDILVGR